MREVRTCDFCGADATGVYEVVPEERRMLLCDGCRDTLASVVDPLLDALDGASTLDASDDAPDGAPERDDAGERAAEDTDPGGGKTGRTGRSPDDGAPADAAGDGARTDREGGSAAEAGGRPVNERGPPRGYRKVVRFLENRDLPIDREEAEALAVDAYGMEPGAVSAAIDHAVKHGRLRDVDGELRG